MYSVFIKADQKGSISKWWMRYKFPKEGAGGPEHPRA
jgi:hypothetical protein